MRRGGCLVAELEQSTQSITRSRRVLAFKFQISAGDVEADAVKTEPGFPAGGLGLYVVAGFPSPSSVSPVSGKMRD